MFSVFGGFHSDLCVLGAGLRFYLKFLCACSCFLIGFLAVKMTTLSFF